MYAVVVAIMAVVALIVVGEQWRYRCTGGSMNEWMERWMDRLMIGNVTLCCTRNSPLVHCSITTLPSSATVFLWTFVTQLLIIQITWNFKSIQEIRYHFVYSWSYDHTHTFSSQEKSNKMFEKYHQIKTGKKCTTWSLSISHSIFNISPRKLNQILKIMGAT